MDPGSRVVDFGFQTNGLRRNGSWILDSIQWIPDSPLWISDSKVSHLLIPDSLASGEKKDLLEIAVKGMTFLKHNTIQYNTILIPLDVVT